LPSEIKASGQLQDRQLVLAGFLKIAITSRLMRLSPYQLQMICQQTHHYFGDSAAILLSVHVGMTRKEEVMLTCTSKLPPTPCRMKFDAKLTFKVPIDDAVERSIRWFRGIVKS